MNLTNLFNDTNHTKVKFPKGYSLMSNMIGWYFWQKKDVTSVANEDYWEIYHQAKYHREWEKEE